MAERLVARLRSLSGGCPSWHAALSYEIADADDGGARVESGTSMALYTHPFACLSCRRCYRRVAARRVPRKCPTCGSMTVAMNRKFKAPKQTDKEQWQKVVFLYEHGFRFQTVYGQDGLSVPYPDSLQEARDFVRLYRQRPAVTLTRVPKKTRSRRRGA